jgi:hypothetical protein
MATDAAVDLARLVLEYEWTTLVDMTLEAGLLVTVGLV